MPHDRRHHQPYVFLGPNLADESYIFRKGKNGIPYQKKHPIFHMIDPLCHTSIHICPLHQASERTLMSPRGRGEGWIGETTDLNFSSPKTWIARCHRSDRWGWPVRPVLALLSRWHRSDRCPSSVRPVSQREHAKTASSSSWLLAWTKLGEWPW
jgi:hypothetical protein